MAAAMPSASASPGAAAPGTLLKLRLAGFAQLFNSLDPAPFRQRELDSEAANYIVDWAGEAPARQPLALQLVLDGDDVDATEAAAVPAAVHDYFRRRAAARRKQVRRLLREGRISLYVAITFILIATALAQWLVAVLPTGRHTTILYESIVVICWVAMWRPAGIFLYDWWPLMSDARLYDRLSTMAVSVTTEGASTSSAA
jgi:hypothetical protein